MNWKGLQKHRILISFRATFLQELGKPYRNFRQKSLQSDQDSNLILPKYTSRVIAAHTYNLFIIVIITMFLKSQACFLFLVPQNEVGPSISSSVFLCSFVLLVYIAMFVLVFYLCPPSVLVVATFSSTVLFPLLCPVLPFFPYTLILFFIQFCYFQYVSQRFHLCCF